MYSQYGDTQYPHGPELGSMRGQLPIDPSGGPARYPYMPYFGSKGPDAAQLAGGMPQRPPYGGEFSSMGNPEAMFNQGWGSMMPGQSYMGHPAAGKHTPYGMQVNGHVCTMQHEIYCGGGVEQLWPKCVWASNWIEHTVIL